MCDKNLEAVIEKNPSIKLCLNSTCGTACVSESVLCLLQICDELGVKRPSSVKVFSGKSERSSSGLLEWESKSDALETLGFLNHYQMKNPSEYLCVLRSAPLWPYGLAGFGPEPSFLPSS